MHTIFRNFRFPRHLLIKMRLLGGAALSASLAGCSSDVMAPAGNVAVQLRNIMGISTFLMLLIVIPVMVAIGLFAWYYRASNERAEYDPDFHHSTSLELLTWAAPLTIVVWLGAITWVSTHQLDPYRPLEQIDARTPVRLTILILTGRMITRKMEMACKSLGLQTHTLRKFGCG